MTSDSPVKTVAIVAPLWVGHHPMYFSQFASAFLRLGTFVIGLCPNPAEALAGTSAAAGMPDLERRMRTHLLPAGKRSWFRGRFEGDPWRTFQRWKRCGDALSHAEVEAGRRADLVFFPYLDSYLRFLPIPGIPQMTINRPWAGLYLRNHHHAERPSPVKALRLLAKGDALVRSKLCRGVGVLDERYAAPMADYTGREVSPFPDVTDASLPGRPFPLAEEILKKAAGRKIIGLLGMERRKGLLNLLRVSEMARERCLPWFFACSGRFERHEYTAQEVALVEDAARRVASGEIDNLHLELPGARIPEETDFNALFRTFDVAWAAYEGFQGSSGTLGKAAAFDVPSLATDGECIGARVQRYRSGLTIPEGDSGQALEAIRLILEGVDWDGRPLVPDFAKFRADHSVQRLETLLSDVLATM